MKTITILLFSILLNGCGASKDATTNLNADMTENTLNGNFIVTTLDSKNNLDKELTLNFDDSTKRVSGFSGCNNFSGTYTVDGNKITFGPLMSTKKMCADSGNEIETTFFKTIEKTNKFNLNDNKITLLKNKKELISADQIISSKIAQTQDDGLYFEYSAITRGTFKMVKVDQNNIKTQLSRTAKEATNACSRENWDILKSLTEAIDLKALSKLEAPSKAHQYDGAAVASLTIKVKGETYQTQAFDDGNPPKEIAELVNKLLSFTTQKTKTEN
ncbi:META domain-containing protein [Olleya sp. R77988]|uniref:META domain-containing protein n=1 Tax=Olleya sp. R77988 TaxID=3093875 RepID=UPI0037C54A04